METLKHIGFFIFVILAGLFPFILIVGFLIREVKRPLSKDELRQEVELSRRFHDKFQKESTRHYSFSNDGNSAKNTPFSNTSGWRNVILIIFVLISFLVWYFGIWDELSYPGIWHELGKLLNLIIWL